VACFTQTGKHDQRERKEKRGRGTTAMGWHPFTGGAMEQELGGSSGKWLHAAGGREGGPSGTWREGGGSMAAALHHRTGERRSPTCGASATVPGGEAKFDSISNFKRIQILSSFDRSKNDFPELKKFEIKYDREGFEERNNFLHRKFFRFEMKFELRFQ
jgi:hypothetical protein